MAGEKVDQNGERRCARRLAESALGSYGLRGTRLLPIAHGWAQQTFRVEPPGRGAYVLNMYRLPRDGGTTDGPGFRAGLGLRSPQTLEAQLLWLGALGRETGLTVPDPVPALDGSLAGRVSLGDGQGRANGHSYALMGWVPGELMGDAPADLSSVGSFVARLHGHAERYRAPDPSALPRWDWHWPFGEAAHLWSRGEEFYAAEEMAVFEEAAQQAWADLEKLGYDAGAFGMIHRDLNFRNLVLSGGAVGAIDFDLCGLGHYMLDLTATLAAMGPLRAGAPWTRPGSLSWRATSESETCQWTTAGTLPLSSRCAGWQLSIETSRSSRPAQPATRREATASCATPSRGYAETTYGRRYPELPGNERCGTS